MCVFVFVFVYFSLGNRKIININVKKMQATISPTKVALYDVIMVHEPSSNASGDTMEIDRMEINR